MILDVMMPQLDGMAVVRAVRKDSQIPILMLSAKTDDLDKIQGLVQGADDYVTKPFNPLGSYGTRQIIIAPFTT